MITRLELKADGSGFRYWDASRKINCSANFPLFLIRAAWSKGCSFEAEADGFGPGLGTMGGDWSGIRDSSEAAIAKMLEKAINHLDLTG